MIQVHVFEQWVFSSVNFLRLYLYSTKAMIYDYTSVLMVFRLDNELIGIQNILFFLIHQVLIHIFTILVQLQALEGEEPFKYCKYLK